MKSFGVLLFSCVFASLATGIASDDSDGQPSSKKGSIYENYVKTVSHIQPDDMDRQKKSEGNQVEGFYTLVSPKQRWPSPDIPYLYETTAEFTDDEKAVIDEAMAEISNGTCITFKAKEDSDTAYLLFQKLDSGCSAQVGYGSGGAVKVNLNPDDGCLDDSTNTIHIIMHALGFEHEQSRYDRDLYVEIQWDNIDASYAFEFEKLPRTYAFPQYTFDFNSVMMYTLDAYGTGGRPSMVLTAKANVSDEYEIGRATNMSSSDVDRIYSAYDCFNAYGEVDYDYSSGRIHGRTHRLTVF